MKKFPFIFLFFLSFYGFARTHYVNNGISTGANNGTSWSNAFFSLSAAMNIAASGDTIKVATGTYRPSGTNSSAHFDFKNGVILLAGYSPLAGVITDDARNWVNYPVVISGVLNSTTTVDELILAQNFTNPAVIDGVFIRGARSSGLRMVNCNSITMRNTVIENINSGAISVTNSSSAVFSNCVFRNNTGRALRNIANSNTALYNCIFATNDAGSWDQGLIINENSVLTLINSSLVNNKASAVFYGSGTGSAIIRNSIFWNNVSATNSFENVDINTTQNLTLSHSLTQSYFDNAVNTLLVAMQPHFLDLQNPAGADNKLFTADDGLQLTTPCSPAINAGNNASVATTPFDILGQPRIFNGGVVDLGPYEMQFLPGNYMRTVYVRNTNNTGTNDGSSWQNAFTTLQQALLHCADTIKMATGTYLTTNSYNDSVFFLENAVLLGGYPATGNPTDEDRDPVLYRTLLQGNYAGVSTGRESPVLKAYHNKETTIIDGLTFNNSIPGGAPGMPALSIGYGSRVQVTNCNFRASAAEGLRSTGVTVSQSSPVFSRCRFTPYNTETGNGLAILVSNNAVLKISYCDFTGPISFPFSTDPRGGTAIAVSNASAIIDSCVFWKVSSAGTGEMISGYSSNITMSRCLLRNLGNYANLMRLTNNSQGEISRTVFRNITGASDPPSVYADHSNPVFTHCLFDSSYLTIENRNYAAPVFNNCVSNNGMFMENKLSFPTLNSCTIVNAYQRADLSSAASEEELVINEDSSTLRANNTIFWGNRLAVLKKDITDKAGSTPARNSVSILTNCLTQNYGTNGLNGNLVGLNPRFYQLMDNDGIDNIMFTPDDGLRLTNCSPAINSGNNTIGTVVANDILQQPRIYNANIDMGAYELQDNPNVFNTYYVNAGATGSNTGTSWQNAYVNFQSAVCNTCADTIRVATGTYKPAVDSRDSSFFINRPVVLMGGYPASGNPGDEQRDPDNYPTVLSGNIGNPYDSLDNSPNVMVIVGVKDSVVIDGFIIRDGYGVTTTPGGIHTSGGAGIFTYYNHTVIRNCQFLNNRTFPNGGGLRMYGAASSRISHTIFYNNSSTNTAGALWYDANGKGLTITNCIFEGNSSYGEGGAIKLNRTPFEVSNTVFYRNYTTAPNQNGHGGAVNADFPGSSGGTGNYFNCTFLENKTASSLAQGGGLYNDGALSQQIRNCIFWGNMSGTSSTSNTADIDPPGGSTVFNSLLQGNRSSIAPNLFGVRPAFIDSAHPKGPDGRWLTADDGLQLNYNSPAINFGNNNIVANLPLDILGNARIVNTTVDAGPYEYQNWPVANAGKDTIICTGTGVQIGKPANPGHSYSWTSSPAGFISNLATTTVNPTTTTSYFLEVTNGSIIARDTITVSLSSSLTPSVSIATPLPAICQGSSVTFTATPVSEGGSPVYQWQVNGANAGTNSYEFTTTILANGDQVKVVLTSSAGCANPATATSNSITMSVNPVLVPSVSISVSSTAICPGGTAVFTATPVNGGTLPYYTWVKGGVVVQSGISNTYSVHTNNFSSGDQVWVVLTSNATCVNAATATSNQITITKTSAITPAVTITASATTICSGTNVTFTATPTNGGSAPSFQWKKNGTNVGTNSNIYSSNTLNQSDIISVTLTSSATCTVSPTANSNSIAMTVTTPLAPTITITSTASAICTGTNVTFTATATNGGASPSFQWKKNGANVGTNSNTYSSNTLIQGDVIAVTLTSNATCVSPATVNSNSITMTVGAPATPAVTITSTATTICAGTNVTFTATATNGGAAPVFQWKKNGANVGTNSTTYSSSTLIQGDVIVVTLTSNAACVSPATASSNAITLSVSEAVNPSLLISGVTTVNPGDPALLTAVAFNGGTSPAYQWQDSTNMHSWQNISGATGSQLNYIPALTGNKVRCILTSNANCASPATATSNSLAFTINTITAISPEPAASYGIRLYPNPVNTGFTIDTLKLSDKWQSLEIESVDGKHRFLTRNITNQTKIHMDVSSLPAGLYFVIIKKKEGRRVYLRFIKQ